MADMKGVNDYHRELTRDQIARKVHREFIGGMWDELGQLQFDFLKQQGLEPHHRLLDIGCGALRGGLHFVRYLDAGNYCGQDINRSLIEAGAFELQEAGLADKEAKLMVDDAFSFGGFGVEFDFMLSVSLFTHLPFNMIVRCLDAARQSLKPDGTYYATYFHAPSPAHVAMITHEPGGVVSRYDADPFHYAIDELGYMAKITGLELTEVGDWGHPRDQRMAAFRRSR